LTRYDWLLARRTAALGVALAALIFSVMVGTDDPLATLGGRLGRLAALSSVAGAGAAFVATEQARSRGELRALGALGVAPVVTTRGAVVGGAAVGGAGAILAGMSAVDLSPLFPRAAPFGGSWVPQGDAWLETTRGVLVRAGGELVSVGATAVASEASHVPRGATVAALGLAAIGLPLWGTARGPVAHRATVALVAACAAVGAFHLVAAERLPAAALAIAPALLTADAWILHRGLAWS
jgi:hypothetical protein